MILLADSDEISEKEQRRTPQELESYQKKCVKQLFNERRSIILRPGKEASAYDGYDGRRSWWGYTYYWRQFILRKYWCCFHGI